VWLATGEVLAWLLAFDFGVPNLLIQRSGAALARGDYRTIGSQFTASLVSLLALGSAVFATVWAVAPLVGPEFVAPLRIAALATCVTIVSHGFVGLSRGLQRTGLVQGFALAGVVIGFALTAWMLLAGHGLVAIACGLLARSAFSLMGGLAFFVFQVDRRVLASLRPRQEEFRDIARNCPSLFVSGIAYALTNNSMATLAAVMVRPEAAAILGVTRKAAEVVRMLLDMLGHASYGGFANLFAEDRDRARAVYRELQSKFFLLATPLMAATVAVNPSLVKVWVGEPMFGGVALSVLLALGMGAGSWSYLQASLLRSMGSHGLSSRVVLAECAARLGAMVLLGSLFGLEGLAVGAVVTAVFAGAWSSRKIATELRSESASLRVWSVRLIPFGLAVLVALLLTLSNWLSVCAAGLATVVLAGGLVLKMDRHRTIRGGV
jgi:O-antigen/teichoic acid export membrane protein